MARQHTEVPLEATDLPLVAAGSGESQPAGVPRLGTRPLALGERRVTQALARRDGARLIELRFRDRQRPLEVTGPLRVLIRPQKQLPARAERLHLGATVLQRLAAADHNARSSGREIETSRARKGPSASISGSSARAFSTRTGGSGGVTGRTPSSSASTYCGGSPGSPPPRRSGRWCG